MFQGHDFVSILNVAPDLKIQNSLGQWCFKGVRDDRMAHWLWCGAKGAY